MLPGVSHISWSWMMLRAVELPAKETTLTSLPAQNANSPSQNDRLAGGTTTRTGPGLLNSCLRLWMKATTVAVLPRPGSSATRADRPSTHRLRNQFTACVGLRGLE